MSNRIELARQLIQDGEFNIAKSMLEKEQGDAQALYVLSLLHRYEDEYDQELAVIKRALEMDGGNAYLQQRLAWHNLPLFDRVVPRQPLNLPRDVVPSQEVLNQLCFVTTGGSDEPFRQLLIELLESLEATQSYKDIPIYIFDAGLTEEDQQFLMQRFKNVKGIKDPGWDLDALSTRAYIHNKENMNGYKAMTARPFIPKHFPGHRYYMWIDTDCWVQDENGIDTLVSLAVQQGIGICPDLIEQVRHIYPNIIKIPQKYQREDILSRHTVMNSVVCIDNEGPYFKLWQKYFLELYEEGSFSHFMDQFSINLALAIEGKDCILAPFQKTQFVVSSNYGCPVLGNNKEILNLNKEVVGIIHLTWYTKEPGYTPYHRPFLKESSQNLSLDHSHNIESMFHRKQTINDADVVYGALSYRIWPWEDKEEIKLLLDGESNV